MPIEELFTPEERRVLGLYRSGNAFMVRSIRLTAQYLVGAGVFVVVAITNQQPWWSLVTFATFAVYALLRVIRGRQIANLMPTIITKYEARILELEAQVAAKAG